MNRMSIAPYEKVVQIYSDSHHINCMKSLKVIENAYEEGMIETLREIAFLDLLKYENQGTHIDPYHAKALQNFNTKFQEALSLCANEKQKSALFKIEEALNNCNALELEKYFIDGFVLGYRFLKLSSPYKKH